MYVLYNLGLCVATVVLLPWVFIRALRGRLPGIAGRLGFFRWEAFPAGGHVLWIHAVSLGEVKASAALAQELRIRIPDLRILVTSSTRTGWNAARELFPAPDRVLFPPWDFQWVCRRFLRRIRPHAVVVFETELWPNFFRECKRAGAALLIANGRISDRTFPRYLATRRLWRKVLSYPDRVFAQSAGDALRFDSLGAPPEKLHRAGNLKYASHPPSVPFVETLREMLRISDIGPVIVAGSTMPGEEQHLLEAFVELRREFPRLWMILAPRHPERFVQVKEQVEARGFPFQLRSAWSSETRPCPGVLIIDAMGELGAMYELATVAYVGGTLVPTGGHNILEPAFFARPIVIGPSMTNFQEIADDFLADSGAGRLPLEGEARAGAIIQIPNAAALTPVLGFLLLHPEFRQRLGEAARKRWKKNSSGVAVVADEVERLLQLRAASQRLSASPSTEMVGCETASAHKMKYPATGQDSDFAAGSGKIVGRRRSQ